MKCRLTLLFIATNICFSALPVHALEATLTKDALPSLAPEVQHETAGKRITSRFTRSHYKPFILDDNFSKSIFNRYLDLLDYNRTVFTQADVDSFAELSVLFDDQLKMGKSSIAFELYNLSMHKRFECLRYALSLLDEEITFTADESIEIDRSKADRPKNQAEIHELWRQRVKYDALNLKLAGKEWAEIKETLGKRYNNTIKRLSQTHNEDVFQLYINAFAREIDPHTSYLSPRNAEQFQSEMNLSLEGIGAVLQMTDDYTVIRSLVVGGPAAQSKQIGEGDRIIGVGQEGQEIVDVIGWRLDDIVQLIKGPKGSKVMLNILPEGKDAKSHVITIVRDKIRLEDRAVKHKLIEKKGKKIGVLEVPGFYVGLTDDTDKLLLELKKQNVDGIIIDLRNNGGGALTEATAFSGLFIKNGPIVQIRDSYGRVNVNVDTDNEVSYQGPMTVLINRYSASASEIFAAAMQDYGRALILGENSFGKGTVQHHRPLNHIYDTFDKPLGYVQYTIQKFYRINGGSTQNKGIVPDIPFPTAIEAEETGESVEDNALTWDSIEPAEYNRLGDNTLLVQKLTQAHQARIASDMEFGFIFDDIKKYKAEKDDKTISLNEEVRKKERDKADSLRLMRVNLRQKALGQPAFTSLEDIPKDYEAPDAYLDEAIAIMLDIIQ